MLHQLSRLVAHFQLQVVATWIGNLLVQIGQLHCSHWGNHCLPTIDTAMSTRCVLQHCICLFQCWGVVNLKINLLLVVLVSSTVNHFTVHTCTQCLWWPVSRWTRVSYLSFNFLSPVACVSSPKLSISTLMLSYQALLMGHIDILPQTVLATNDIGNSMYHVGHTDVMPYSATLHLWLHRIMIVLYKKWHGRMVTKICLQLVTCVC